MKDWRNKFLNFMAGRYGMDNFNRFLIGAGLILWVVGLFGIGICSKLALVCFIIYIYRFLSKNYNQRYNENQLFLKYTEKLRWNYSQLKKNANTESITEYLNARNARKN